MLNREQHYVIFGTRDLDTILSAVQEPIASLQIFAFDISPALEAEVMNLYKERLKIVKRYQDLIYHKYSRLLLLDDSKAMQDFYFDWSGRQDFPFVVTLKESSRPAIFEKNQLAEFDERVDFLLKELVS